MIDSIGDFLSSTIFKLSFNLIATLLFLSSISLGLPEYSYTIQGFVVANIAWNLAMWKPNKTLSIAFVLGALGGIFLLLGIVEKFTGIIGDDLLITEIFKTAF